MFLTHVIKNIYTVVFLILTVINQPVIAQYSLTNEIISNDIKELEGRGDTLWMLTSHGVNFSTGIIENPILWNGIKNIQAIDITFHSGKALMCLMSDNALSNNLFLFSLPDKQETITLNFQSALFRYITPVEKQISFWAIDAVWFKESFWIACLDGGLVQLKTERNDIAIYRPGYDNSAFTFETFLPESIAVFPDLSARVVSVATDEDMLWVACEKALWSFNPADTQWTRINDSILEVQEYYDLEVRKENDSVTIFSTIEVNRDEKRDTSLYVYNVQTGQWRKFIDEMPFSVAPGANDYVYVMLKDELNLYLDTIADTTIGTETAYIKSAHIKWNEFKNRIIESYSELVNFNIMDIHYTVQDNDTLFFIATDQGLFFSTDEHNDERIGTPFRFERRNVKIKAGLKKTYAVPGIINNSHLETVFAYNLSEDDHVTIDIFDYNMDHVVRIVDNVPREAGIHKSSGRSTDSKYDRWDGTVNNNNGRSVAPGIYYYRISTKKGMSSFGKIIVARN